MRFPSFITELWVVRVVSTAARTALERRAPEAAASVGFFAVFSFFPVLLIMVAVSGFVLSDTQTQEQVLSSVLRFLPVSRELVSANMRTVLTSRGAVGFLGAAGLMWSATSAFTVFVSNLNRAWHGAVPRGAIKSRLIALALLGSLTGLAVLYLAAGATGGLEGGWAWVSRTLTGAERPVPHGWRSLFVVPIFAMLLCLYRFVPAYRVRWRDAAAGALAATVAFAVATGAFTWYLDSGLARYNIVYGSLGALVALLAWIYILSLVALLGGHLCAAIDSVRRWRVAEGGGEGARVPPSADPSEAAPDSLLMVDAPTTVEREDA
jgi:membrane protein